MCLCSKTMRSNRHVFVKVKYMFLVKMSIFITTLLELLCFGFILCANQESDFQTFLSTDPYATYNKNVFPKTDQTQQVVVSMKYSLIAISEMDETMGQIHLVGFFDASWANEFLTSWVADIDEMVIAQNNFWLPPITLHNTVETLKTIGYRSNKLRIKKDGTHQWKVGLVSVTSCEVSMSHYPFDEHTCALEFTPWGYQEDQGRVKDLYREEQSFLHSVCVFLVNLVLKLENSTSEIDLTFFTENTQWTIQKTSISSKNINGVSYLIFSLKIARRPGNTLINYALPVLVLSILSSLAYMMPAESGERIAFSVVSFLSLVIYITMIADNIPRSSSPITILSLFLTLNLLMNALLIAMATLTLRVYSQEVATEIPVWIKHATMFLKCQKGKRIKCCSRKKKKRKRKQRSNNDDSEDDDDELEFDENDDDDSMEEENLDWDEMEWKDVGNVLDWTFFILFIIMTSVIALFFYIPLAVAENNQ